MGSLGHCIIWKQVGHFRCFYQIEVRSVFTEKIECKFMFSRLKSVFIPLLSSYDICTQWNVQDSEMNESSLSNM